MTVAFGLPIERPRDLGSRSMMSDKRPEHTRMRVPGPLPRAACPWWARGDRVTLVEEEAEE